MEENFLIKSPKDCLISSFWSSKTSSLICSIKAVQKGENENSLEVIFNLEDRLDIRKMVEDTIVKTVVDFNPITKLIVTFYIVVEGFDVFSCAVNAFSSCGILTGIKLKDTIASTTILKNNCSSLVIYMLHSKKIIGFYLDGELSNSEAIESIRECVEDCKLKGELVKSRVIEEINKLCCFVI